MTQDQFPSEVQDVLKHYVYRLIDPRNGETFYVGKGQGNRVFHHATGQYKEPDKRLPDDKSKRINAIINSGFQVGHVIHRHGMTEDAALEVEAALIDAYPGLENIQRGIDAETRGSRHADEIIVQYAAEPFEVKEKLILISIRNSHEGRDLYHAVRGVWRVNRSKAEEYKLVLGHVDGLVKCAYRPTRWLGATEGDFPHDPNPDPKRSGFDGHRAEDVIWSYYVNRRVPDRYKVKGARNAIRYCHRDDPTNL